MKEIKYHKSTACILCAGLPHRVKGDVCDECGTEYAKEEPPTLEGVLGWERETE